mgnify:CR=1 FL=1
MSLERFHKAVTEMRTKQAAARDHRSYSSLRANRLLARVALAKASVREMEAQRLIWNSLQRSQIVAFEISGEWTGRIPTRGKENL